MEKAIQKAIKGGWSTSYVSLNSRRYHDKYLLDPLFWQALGKSLGWIDEAWPNGEMKCENKFGRCDEKYCSYGGYKNPYGVWHNFIDHLAEGKDIESFFQTLLANH